MPYAIHLRKSRADLEAEARGEGESLARHLKTLLALAERRGYPIAKVYSEGIVSGDRLSDRPEMQRLLRDVSAGMYAGVLDMEIARLTRGDPMDQAYIQMVFKYSNTRIITPDRIYDLSDDYDEDYIQSDMMHARRELKYTKKRLQRGRNTSAAEGLWQSPAPYGYKKVKIPRGKGFTLEPDPDTAPFVRLIFELYANENLGGSKIAERLNALGSRTARGNLWTAHSIVQLSNNPVYAGFVRWNDRVSTPRIVDGQVVIKREKNPNVTISKGQHPPLISMELWEAAQRSRASHDKTRCHSSAPVRNPLAGLLFCSVCGRSMIRKDNGNASGSKYDIVRCVTPDCPTTSIALDIVERTVLDTLALWAVQYADDVPASPADDARQSAIASAQASIARLNAQRDRIFAAYEDGAYDSATFIRRRNDKDAEIAAAQSALDDLMADTTPTVSECIQALVPRIRTALDLYAASSDVQDKNRILKSLISRIDYSKTARCTRNQDPTQFLTLTISPVNPFG